MPRDERKRQKALMKKRSKQKAAPHNKSHQSGLTSASPQTMISRARTFPIYECLISDSWQKENPGLVQILLARQQPDGDICWSTYLVDKLCLGVKDTFANANFSRSRYQNEVPSKIFHGTKPVECSPELAHQMIYASIDFAAQFGFQPHKDFMFTQYLLTPRGELEEPYKLTFGRDGKPLYISGPHDNPDRIIRQLEKTAGPGNFDYLVGLGEF